MRRPIPSILLILAAGACGGNEPEEAPPSAEIRDSAGVRVVVNPAPTPTGPRFTLSPAPLASIGAMEGAPEYMLTRASAVRLSDGTIVVFNGGTQELRFFDASGRYLRTVGREGEGPGEFMNGRLAGRIAGDSLLVLNGGRGARVVSPADGRMRSVSFSPDLGFAPVFEGALANGRMLFLTRDIPGRGAPSGVFREPHDAVWLDPDGSLTPLGTFPGQEISRVTGRASFPVPLGPGIELVANGNRAAVGDNASYSVNVYDAAGTLIQIVRVDQPPRPAEPGDFELALSPVMRLDSAGNRPQTRFTITLDQMPRHETRPAFGEVHVDDEDNLWVADYDVEFQGRRRAWSVFDPEGIYVGRVELPGRSSLLDVGPDWILALTLDDLDVQHVVLYGMTAPTP